MGVFTNLTIVWICVLTVVLILALNAILCLFIYSIYVMEVSI